MIGRIAHNCLIYINSKFTKTSRLPLADNVLFVLMMWALLLVPGQVAATANENIASSVRWPLDLPTRYLTSNFMEYRDGRFHAGLDLKTQTVTGFPVFAVEDGWISRVRATHNAYGRAVYMQGKSGKTYVFAHLSRFADFIREPINKARAKSGRYRTRLEFSANAIPVKQGQVIALTGQSGTNGPHLHFEVRDSSQRPQNPLNNGFPINDTLAPRIFSVRAIPASAEAQIAGRNIACKLENNTIAMNDRVTELSIQGPVAFSARIVDTSDIRGHKLEPWLIEVTLNGKTVYRCANDSYAFRDNSLQRLEWLEMPGVREHWLHRRPANTLPGRSGNLWYLGQDGEGLSPGTHVLKIRAIDQAGNESEVQINLKVETPDVSVNLLDWKRDPLEIVIDEPGLARAARLTPFFTEIHPDAEKIGYRFLDPATGDPVLASTTLWTVLGGSGKLEIDQAVVQGLTPIADAVRYLAADWPLDAAVAVDLPEQAGPVTTGNEQETATSLGIYYWDDDEWDLVDNLRSPDKGSTGYSFLLTDPGLYSVMKDGSPPGIIVPKSPMTVEGAPKSKIPGVTNPRWQIFPVYMIELGSGIDSKSIKAAINGKDLVVEPDFPRNRVLVELPESVEPGFHILGLKVCDKAGNPAEAEIELEIR